MTAEPRVEELLATIRKAIDHDISELDKRGVVVGARKSAASAQRTQPDADQELIRLRDRVGRQKADLPPVPPQPSFVSRATRMEPRSNGVSAILTGAGTGNVPPPPAAILRPGYANEVEAPPPRAKRPVAYQPSAPRFIPLPDPAPTVETHHYAPEPMPQQQQHYAQPPQTYAPQDVTWVEEAPHAPQDAYYPPPPQGGALMSPDSAYATQASFQALANSMLSQLGGDGRLEDVSRDMLRPLLKQWLDDNLPSLVEKLVREEIERVARRGR